MSGYKPIIESSYPTTPLFTALSFISMSGYKHVPISIGEYTFPGDLIQFDLSDFDIILGMNWLHAYEAKIDCKGTSMSPFPLVNLLFLGI